MLKNQYLDAKIGLDTGENEPSKVCRYQPTAPPNGHLYRSGHVEAAVAIAALDEQLPVGEDPAADGAGAEPKHLKTARCTRLSEIKSACNAFNDSESERVISFVCQG